MKDLLYILVILAVAVCGIMYADAVKDDAAHRYDLENTALREEADIWRQAVEDSQAQIDYLLVQVDSLERTVNTGKKKVIEIKRHHEAKTDSVRRLPAGAVLDYISSKLAQPDSGR